MSDIDWNRFDREQLFEKEKSDHLFKSGRFYEIIKLMTVSQKESFSDNNIIYEKDNSIFKDTDEFYTFCNYIENNTQRYPENGDLNYGDSVLYYFNELFCLNIFYGQGVSYIINKLESPIINRDNIILGEDSSGNKCGYYRVDFKNSSFKTYFYGDPNLVIQLILKNN